MHSAPAVSYPVGRSSVRAACLVLPWLLVAFAGMGWFLQSGEFAAVHGLMLFLCMAGAGLAYMELRRPAQVRLGWDGQYWGLESSDGYRAMGAVHARLDWQQGLLLEFQALDGRRCWLWLERRRAPLLWDGLRRAVYGAASAPVAAAPAEARPGGGGS